MVSFSLRIPPSYPKAWLQFWGACVRAGGSWHFPNVPLKTLHSCSQGGLHNLQTQRIMKILALSFKSINKASLKVQFSSVTQSCPTLCDPMDCSTPGFPVHHQLPEFTQTHVHWVGDAIQPSHLLSSPLFPPSIFPSIRVFSNESAIRIRRPKYCSFSFSISPSNEYSGLISFRMDWLELLAV